MIRKAWTQLGIAWFNIVITYFPSHHVRQLTLRMWGAKIGSGVSIGRGTQILDIENLTIGDDCSLGFRCMLDARGGITLEHDVVLASDTHIVTAQHDVHADDFHALEGPVHIGHHAWIASRATIVMGVTIGHGAVVGACSLVRKDVAPMEIVAGVPAQHRGVRRSSLDYSSHFRRLFY